MKTGSLALLLAAASAVLVTPASSAEIKVLSTPTLKTTLDDLSPKFERMTGHKLVTKFEAVAVLKREIEAGETFDVTILLPAAIDDLIKQGRVIARTDISRSGVGVAVRAGAAKPDVGSVDAGPVGRAARLAAKRYFHIALSLESFVSRTNHASLALTRPDLVVRRNRRVNLF